MSYNDFKIENYKKLVRNLDKIEKHLKYMKNVEKYVKKKKLFGGALTEEQVAAPEELGAEPEELGALPDGVTIDGGSINIRSNKIKEQQPVVEITTALQEQNNPDDKTFIFIEEVNDDAFKYRIIYDNFQGDDYSYIFKMKKNVDDQDVVVGYTIEPDRPSLDTIFPRDEEQEVKEEQGEETPEEAPANEEAKYNQWKEEYGNKKNINFSTTLFNNQETRSYLKQIFANEGIRKALDIQPTSINNDKVLDLAKQAAQQTQTINQQLIILQGKKREVEDKLALVLEKAKEFRKGLEDKTIELQRLNGELQELQASNATLQESNTSLQDEKKQLQEQIDIVTDQERKLSRELMLERKNLQKIREQLNPNQNTTTIDQSPTNAGTNAGTEGEREGKGLVEEVDEFLSSTP